VLVLDLDIHFSGGTVDIFRGAEMHEPAGHLWENVKVVDVFGARGQPLRNRARAEGRRWAVHEELDNALAVNVALLASNAGDDVYLGDDVWGRVEREIRNFLPHLLLISAGFDGARGDDEGFELTSSGYHELISRCVEATHCPIVMALEGGYKPRIVAACVAACVCALLGEKQ
jgi:acetoin utilization deacetylase AcuC-like enzyme